MYYLTQGSVTISGENDCTLNFIKEHCPWEKGIVLSSIFPFEVYNCFLEEARYLKNSIHCFITENYKEYNIPFYFLLKDNEIIACAAQEIINGKLQEVTINWYTEN